MQVLTLRRTLNTHRSALDRLLGEISHFVQKEASSVFLKLIFNKDRRISRIDEYHRRISTSVDHFKEGFHIFRFFRDWPWSDLQISTLLNNQAWKARNDRARAADQHDLNAQLIHLQKNHQQLISILSLCFRNIKSAVQQFTSLRIDVHQRNAMAIMVSLQKRLRTTLDADRERQFFSYTLEYLMTSYGSQTELEDWMITSYEVEFGPEIGSGGL